MSSLNYMELCRLCLVKERVSIPIFEGEGDVRQIFLKIASCLPVKVARDDKLPKKICDDCMYKLDNAYQFWNTTANAEKQLLQWLGEIANDDKKGVPSNTIETEQLVLKEEAIEQDQGSELAKSLSRVEAVLADDDRGGSEDEDESESEDEGSNSEDSGDDDGGVEAPGKEEAESDEEPYEPLEPTTFVNVSLAGCDEAGPSGIQQQQQQGQQEGQASQQVQQSQSSQFLAPGAPSTSTAVPASASGLSEDTSVREFGASGTGHVVVASFGMNQSAMGCITRAPMGYALLPFAYIAPQPLVAIGDKNEDVNIGLDNPPEANSDVNSNSYIISNTNTDTHMKESEPNVHTRTPGKIDINHSFPVEPGDRDKVFTCEFCGKKYSNKWRLNKHIVSHKDDRPFSCNICTKTFKRNDGLTAHKKRHKERKGYKCDVCGVAILSKNHLELHKKRHLGAYDFKCDVCSKSFLSKNLLNNHKIVHSGKRQFKCDICESSFFYRSYLNVHMRNSHPTGQDMPDYQCEECGRKFRRKASFLRHVKSHTGFLCDLCGKALASRTSLETHRRVHTGEKPEVCAVCGKTFSTSFSLRLHMRTHTGERPHTCDQCGKTFTQRSSLTVHKRYHTGVRPYRCNICNKDFVTKTLMKTHQKRHNVSL